MHDLHLSRDHVTHLVVIGGEDHLLEGDHIGLQGAQPRCQHSAPALPVTAATPHVQGRHSHGLRAGGGVLSLPDMRAFDYLERSGPRFV